MPRRAVEARNGWPKPMLQEERSERSRTHILDAALILFSHRGYGATSVQDIADGASVSKGNVYHHFADKESIFRELLDQYFAAMSRPDFPFNRALATGTFPENLEELGRATRHVVEKYRAHVALIYVDVVEFDGSHIRKFYEDMSQRFDHFMKETGIETELRSKLAEGLSPISAVMLATRILFNYFSVEILFGVKDHFGKDTDEAVREIARILRHGMLREGQPVASRAAARAPRRTPAPARKHPAARKPR
jgi:AcrR family transcriptional regulator